MSTRRELDDRIAAARLDERIREYQRQQVEQRARQRYWAVLDVHAADKIRRRWRPLVLAGNARCGSCHKPIAPEDRWVIDPNGPGPEHASCVVDDVR